MERELVSLLNLPRRKTAVIYNAVDFDKLRLRGSSSANPLSGPGPHLLSVGSLSHKKGHDRAIQMLRHWKEEHPDILLTILGEGAEKPKLEAFASRLGVSSHVCFAGYRDPVPYLAHADLFLLPSRYEGLPNVLLEALAVGCPVLVLSHPGGTLEVMKLFGQEHFYLDAFPKKLELRERSPRYHPSFEWPGALKEYAAILLN